MSNKSLPQTDPASQSPDPTLEQIGTPWAETYRGSGRLTGNLASEPVRMDTGEIAPGWSYLGSMTQNEFNQEFEWQQHREFHSALRPDWQCEYCDKAGWNGLASAGVS